MEDSFGYRNKNEIDNLIIAAAAASSDQNGEDQSRDHLFDPISKTGIWRSVSLQAEHADAIRNSVLTLCENQQDLNFQPQPYSKKLGTEEEYQEMVELTDFKGENEFPDRIELMRKHSMIFKPTGPQSKALTLFEQAVNEAAAQICFLFPSAIFHKRNLAYMAKTAVKKTCIDFPNANTSRHLLTGLHPESSHDEEQDLSSLGRNDHSNASFQQGNHAQKRRDNSTRFQLSHEEYQMIAESALQKAGMIPQFDLKTREQCDLVENYVYAEAIRLANIDPEALDNEMKVIRDASAIYGRHPSGPRNHSILLSPFEVGMNEAAAWVVRFAPSMLTYRRQLTEWARRVLNDSGVNLSQVQPNAQTPSHPHQHNPNLAYHDKNGSHMSPNPEILHTNNNNYVDFQSVEYELENHGHQLSHHQARTSTNGLMGMGNGPGGLIANYEDEESAISSDNHELIKFLGGSQAIAQLTDHQLEDLGRAQFTVIDPATDNEMANTSMFMTVEEDDRPLDAFEILRATGKSSLTEVTSLIVPCSGYTSINAMDLACCVKLKELDLSENALRVFPRRLHLPRLRKLGLTGNRFFHVPMVEQFPRLVRLSIDDKIRAQMNMPMVVYFCPQLKYVNGQYIEEMRSDFTARVIHEAKSFLEPQIRSRWEQEFGDQVTRISSRSHLFQIAENILSHIGERSNLVDDSINKYKDLILFRFIEDFLRQKFLHDDQNGEEDFIFSVKSDQKSRSYKNIQETELALEKLDSESSQNAKHRLSAASADSSDEEKDMEARAAGEKALFDAADELLGMNLPDIAMQQQALVNGQNGLATLSSPFASMQMIDAHGQLSGSVNAQGVASLALPPGYPSFHLGRSLRQGRSVIMTIVKAQGITGRPIAEFLPGELRNKDYVKGYMASEIYKKAVKDTLGQKVSPKKSNLSKSRKSESAHPRSSLSHEPPPASYIKSNQYSTTTPNQQMHPTSLPLAENNQQDKKNSLYEQPHYAIGEEQLKNLEMTTSMMDDVESYENSSLSLNNTPLPPRPKKRKPMTGHKSLRDLCTEPEDNRTENSFNNPGAKSDQMPIDYDPLHFIRCHAKDNDAGDSETKVWRCLFEPNPKRPEETTHTVATCGGECVCLINCESGKVLKRYKVVDEEFYTIAWTTVVAESGISTNILAAAGKLKEIRLLHPEQLVCYSEMKGHTEDITAMIFHQTQPTVLFSGDSKASVLVWDIGIPSVPNYKTSYQLLMRLRCPRLDVNPVLNLVFLPHYAYLIAGCEDGLFAWKISELRLEKREREPDMELKIEAEHEVCIDALSQLSDNALVIKVVETGEISVFDFASVLERRKGLQRVVPLEMRGHLSWQKTDEIYINVSVRQNLGAVLCGDNEGSIWIYDLDPYLDDLHASTRKKFFVKPIRILEWPECSVQGNRDEDQQLKESISSGFRNPVVNSVEMSSDGHYLSAVTDNNLVCIWRYAPSNATAKTGMNDSSGGGSSGTPKPDGVFVNAI